MTFQEFLSKAREVHRDKYEYVPWEGNVPQNSKIKIICPVHGEFMQVLKDHLRGHGCNRCGGSYKLTNEEFKEKMFEIYGDSLDFSETVYINSKTNVRVICPLHGEFYSSPKQLLDGTGCTVCNFMNGKNLQSNSFWKLCSKEQKTKWVIEKLKQIYGDKYSYDLIGEINAAKDIITLVCPKHGEFKKSVTRYLIGHGCPKCGLERTKAILKRGYKDGLKQNMNCPVHRRFNEEICKNENCTRYQKCLGNYKTRDKNFKNKIKEIFGDDIDLSKTNCYNVHENIKIICPKHGEFGINAYSLIKGIGCPVCRFLESKRSLPFWKLPTETITKYVIEKFKLIHGERYSYDLIVEITSEHDYVNIRCNKDGNIFRQEVKAHLAGNGCPYCNFSKFEERFESKLIKENIVFEKYKKFKWLGLQNFDFYLPEYNIAIECQGKQHFESVDLFGGDKEFNKRIERDIRKYNLAKTNNQKLFYLLYPKSKCSIDYINSFQEIYTPENTFKDMDLLINKIRETT